MRTQILVTKLHIFWVILLLTGLFCSFYGLNARIRYASAHDFSSLSEENCKEGVYVKGPIYSCVRRKMYPGNNYSGESKGYITLSKTVYSAYTIPIKDGRFIYIMVYDDTTKEGLKNLVNEKETAVPFLGEIIKASDGISFSYEWHQDIEGFDADRLETRYEVRQINVQTKYETGYFGVMLLLLCIGILLSGRLNLSGLLYREPIEKKDTFYRFEQSYNKENELHAETAALENLKRQLADLRKSFILRLPFFLFGLILCLVPFYSSLKMIGIFFILFSLKKIAVYFLNSENRISMRVARLINYDSLALEIAKRLDNIRRMEESLEKDRRTDKTNAPPAVWRGDYK